MLNARRLGNVTQSAVLFSRGKDDKPSKNKGGMLLIRCAREGRIVSDKQIIKERVMRFWKVLYGITASLICLSILTACARIPGRTGPAMMAVFKPPDVVAQVTSGGSKLQITSPGSSKCKVVNQGNGCVHVDEGDVALITFKLAAPANWRFTSLKICKGNDKNNLDCGLDIWTQAEFLATDENGTITVGPGNSGVIDLTLIGSNLDEFILLDQNQKEQEYFYSVTACDDTLPVPQCPVTDPVLENKGRN